MIPCELMSPSPSQLPTDARRHVDARPASERGCVADQPQQAASRRSAGGFIGGRFGSSPAAAGALHTAALRSKGGHLASGVLLRWAAIGGLGGYGVYTLIAGLVYSATRPDVNWAVFWFFVLPFTLVCSGVLIAPAWFLLRRQYPNLCILAATLASLATFLLLFSLPEDLGLSERIRSWSIESGWGMVLGFPYSLATLIVPFYVARWVYRRGLAVLLKYVHDSTSPERTG